MLQIIWDKQARDAWQEIADYLGYADRNRMKRVYIDPILGELLEMTSSESKNSPNQKYITKTK